MRVGERRLGESNGTTKGSGWMVGGIKVKLGKDDVAQTTLNLL